MHTTTLLRTASSLRLLVAAVATALLTPVSVGRAQEGAPGSSVALPPELERARTALDKYRDPIVAVHDGYLSTVEGPMEGHKPLMPEGLHHYDLHVWLWKANPAGVFSPTNTAVKCPKKGYSFAESAPKMVPIESHQR